MRLLSIFLIWSAASCRQASRLEPPPHDCTKAEFAVEAATIWLSRQRFRDQYIPGSAREEDDKDHWNIWIRNVEEYIAPAEGLIEVSKANCRPVWIPLKYVHTSVLPNPLQRTTPLQGHWCNINEPFVRRGRR